MKVSIKENVLEVATGIKKVDFDKNVTDMVVKDDKGNIVFALEVDPEKGAISKLSLTCNTVVNGELAVTMIIPIGVDSEDLKIKHGKALVNAEKGLEVIAKRIEADTKAIDEIFEEEATAE